MVSYKNKNIYHNRQTASVYWETHKIKTPLYDVERRFLVGAEGVEPPTLCL